MASKLTVVISQAQGKNPVKRRLEEDLATRLLMEPGIDVSVVPHLYDLKDDHTGLLFLRSVPGDMVILGWLYPRALRWVLDRQNVHGHEGLSLLVPEDADEDEDPEESHKPHGIGPVEVSNRKIYCIDLRTESKPEPYLEEIRRIQREGAQQLVGLDLLGWIDGSPSPAQMDRFLHPLPIVPEASPAASSRPPSPNGHGAASGNGRTQPADPSPPPPSDAAATSLPMAGQLHDFSADEAARRWYPVIDYSRCTNCMECIDFCLFGVYGVDKLDRILVEAQDNCKKGCPACSRVCPENAIIFPQHKSPGIAGADGEVAGLKIDLSKLFGGDGKDSLELAVAERDAELVRDGRQAVGLSVGIPKRQTGASGPRDELDELIDGLDALDV